MYHNTVIPVICLSPFTCTYTSTHTAPCTFTATHTHIHTYTYTPTCAVQFTHATLSTHPRTYVFTHASWYSCMSRQTNRQRSQHMYLRTLFAAFAWLLCSFASFVTCLIALACGWSMSSIHIHVYIYIYTHKHIHERERERFMYVFI